MDGNALQKRRIKMSESGFVVEHMDNNGFNCSIENLCFLSSDENKAKGFTVDKYADELRDRVALNMFKDFTTGFFQITIFCNDSVRLYNKAKNESRLVSALKLLYTSSYEIVINDAKFILLKYKDSGVIPLHKVSYDDCIIEEARIAYLSEKDLRKSIIETNEGQYLVLNENVKIEKIPYVSGWVPGTNKKIKIKKTNIKIKLDSLKII